MKKYLESTSELQNQIKEKIDTLNLLNSIKVVKNKSGRYSRNLKEKDIQYNGVFWIRYGGITFKKANRKDYQYTKHFCTYSAEELVYLIELEKNSLINEIKRLQAEI